MNVKLLVKATFDLLAVETELVERVLGSQKNFMVGTAYKLDPEERRNVYIHADFDVEPEILNGLLDALKELDLEVERIQEITPAMRGSYLTVPVAKGIDIMAMADICVQEIPNILKYSPIITNLQNGTETVRYVRMYYPDKKNKGYVKWMKDISRFCNKYNSSALYQNAW